MIPNDPPVFKRGETSWQRLELSHLYQLGSENETSKGDHPYDVINVIIITSHLELCGRSSWILEL